MADNSPQNGTDTIRDIDKAAVKTQVFIIDQGGAGTESLVTLASPQRAAIHDGTTAAAIKAASTAATAADTALVVAIHPSSNTVSTFGGSVASSTAGLTAAIASATGTSNTTAICVANVTTAGNATITLKGTFSGTYFFEISDDSGTTWYTATAVKTDTNVAATSTGATTAIQMWNVSCPGITHLRVRCGTFVSGTCTVLIAPGGFLYTPVVAVQQATITKGTPGTTGVTTQDLKDAGRSARILTLDSFAVAATTETLNTMSYSTDNGTLTTGTSYNVTTGKRLRIQQIAMALHTIAGNTVGTSVIIRVRVNNAGAAIVSSPIQLVIPLTGTSSVNMSTAAVVIPFPDGWEFVAGAGIGITTTCVGFVATTAAPKVDITIIGFEY